MKPYYERDGITIYCGDCLAVMADMSSASVDVVITDPPYGVSWGPTSMRTAPLAFESIHGDCDTSMALHGIRDALRILREKRHLYAFGRFSFDGLPVQAPTELIWDRGKAGLGDLSSVWGPAHEYIQFVVKISSKANRADGRGSLPNRLRRGSVLSYPNIQAGASTLHLTEKPVALLRELVECSSRFGETVLDPFAGVGSTLVAAELEGRRAIGIEIEERYCEIAAKRLSQRVMFGVDT